MIASHDCNPITRQTSNRVNATGMGLGLVRLLLDAGLTDEARRTLSSLQNELNPRLHHGFGRRTNRRHDGAGS